MQRRTIIKPLVRASLVISLMLGLVTGVTYAALQSQQSKFTGSTIQTSTANLLISHDGVNFANSQAGFTFANVIPGGSLAPANGYSIILKNAGGTALALKLAVSSTPTNPDNVDLTKVFVNLTSTNSTPVMTIPLQTLIDSQATGGYAITNPAALFSGNIYQYILQVSMAKDAFAGPSANIGAIDLSFSGTTVL